MVHSNNHILKTLGDDRNQMNHPHAQYQKIRLSVTQSDEHVHDHDRRKIKLKITLIGSLANKTLCQILRWH